MNFSPRFDTPPPRMTRSGQMSWSMRSRYSFSSGAHCAQEWPLRSRAPADAAARRPCRGSRCGRARGWGRAPRPRTAPTRSPCRGQHQHHARDALAGAEPHLGESGGVGVVEDDDGAAHRLGEGLDRVHADPALVDVGRRHGRPPDDQAREADAHGPSSGPSSAMSAAVAETTTSSRLGRGHAYPLALEDAAARSPRPHP